MSRLSLRIRIMGAVALGLSAVLVLLGLFSLQMIDDSKARLLGERLITARAVADRLDDALSMTVQELTALAAARDTPSSAPSRRASPAVPSSDDRERWRALVPRVPLATYGLYGFDRRGVMTAGSRPEGDRAALAAVDTVRQAATRRRVAVSGLLQAPVTRTPITLTCVPTPTGALCAATDLAKLPFDHYISGIQLGRTGHAVIVDAAGRVLASTDAGDRFGADEHPDFHARLIARREAGAGPAAYYHNDVKVATHVMAFAPLRIAPWGVSFGQTEAETLAPVAHARSRLLAIGAVALLMALAFAWWDTGAIIRPLRLLAAHARRIAGGDLSGVVRVDRGDEVGELAENFETMRAQLSDQKRRLRELAAIEERERIGRDLHDSTMQSLYGISLTLEAARAAMPGGPESDAAKRVDQSLTAMASVSDEIRSFVRGLDGLAQREGTLLDALDAIAAEVSSSGVVSARVEAASPPPDLPAEVRAQLAMIAHEAAGNAVRHGRAEHVTLRVDADADAMVLTVTDDGRGFDPAAARASGSGLRNMRTRAASIGASVDVQSAPGKGTAVRVVVPRAVVPRAVVPPSASREAAS